MLRTDPEIGKLLKDIGRLYKELSEKFEELSMFFYPEDVDETDIDE